MKKVVKFFTPNIDETEHKLVKSVLDNHDGSVLDKFVDEFKAYVGAEYALPTSNGTAALHLAMCAIELKRGDKVLCSVNAFPSVPEVVRHFDAEPIFVDIDEDTFNMDLDKLELALDTNKSKKLKAVIFSHVAGQSTDLERLYNLGKLYNVKIIEDASDALGAMHEGQPIGSTGADITTFSFRPHLKDAPANGGVLVTNTEKIYDRAVLICNHGFTTNDAGLDYFYDVIDIGHKYDMGELSAAYCLAQLRKNNSKIKRRLEIVELYNEKLKELDHITVPVSKYDHSFSLYIIKIDKNRDDFARRLKERGVECGLHYIPLHLLSYYKSKYSLKVNSFPVALRNYQQILSIPLHVSLTEKDINFICEQIKDVTKNRV